MQRNPLTRTDGQTHTDSTMMQEKLVADQNRGGGIGSSGTSQFEWVDLTKAIAILWIFLNHVSEKLFGFPYFANPDAHWPLLADRFHQLAPISGYGLWDLPLNLIRWIGWSGDQGVQLFLILSGFGLAWGLLRKNAPDRLALFSFYRRRLSRILPLWWAVHALALVAALVGGYAVLSDYRFYLSLLGIRVTPQLLYYLQPGWWYIGLLLQLYFIFPLLWYVLRTRGLARFFVYFAILPVCVRFLGLHYFQEYLDAWSRGAIFITRLPEFALGMMLASWFHGNPAFRLSQLRKGRTWIGGLTMYITGVFASFVLSGMAVAPALLGAGAFLTLFKPICWFGGHTTFISRPLLWIGKHSYALYLIHGFPIRFIVPEGIPPDMISLSMRVILAFLISCVAAFVLDGCIDWFLKMVLHSREH